MEAQESSSNSSPRAKRVRRTTREQLRLVDKSLKSRFTRIRNRLVFMIQSTLGAGLAFYVAHDFFGHEQPFFAPMAVIIILGLSGSDRLKRAVDMSIGGIVGVLVGTLLVDALGTGPIHMTIIIGLALVIGSFVTGSQLVSNQIVIAAILIATILPPEEMGGFSRAIDAIIGAVIGLTMIVLIPSSPLRAGRSEVSKVLGITASVLSDVSKGLQDNDPTTIQEARDAVRGTQDDINNMLNATKGGAETAKLSPFLWSSQRNVRSLERILTPVDNVVRGTRVLSRRALAIGHGVGTEPERRGHKRLHHQNDPAHQSGNPADERNGGQVIGQRQPVEQERQKDREQGETDVLVQIGNGLANKGERLAHRVRHVHHAERRGKPPG